MFFLKRNLPIWERALRLAAVVVILWLALSGVSAGIVTWLAFVTAATMALTAFVSFCPACALVGRRYLGQYMIRAPVPLPSFCRCASPIVRFYPA